MKLSVKVKIKDYAVFSTLVEMADAMSQAERSLYRCLHEDADTYAKYKPQLCRAHGLT